MFGEFGTTTSAGRADGHFAFVRYTVLALTCWRIILPLVALVVVVGRIIEFAFIGEAVANR